MAYPDTTLPSDLLDPEYGGRPATEFGGPAWRWINSVVRFLASAFLSYLRVPYSMVVVLSQSSASVGDVAVMVVGNALANSGFDVRKVTAGLTVPAFLGIYADGTGALLKARVITSGIVPAAITGIAAQSTPQFAGLDATAGRLRVAQAGDYVLGVIDLQGNVLLTGSGMLLT